MGNSSTVMCDNIEKKLKLFLEDLLMEEEYQAFLDHLEACPKCKKYVGSVDAFSNQLWKLGDVKVPSDFCSTVLFKLAQSTEEPLESSYTISKKQLLTGCIAILMAMALFFGINYFEFHSFSSKKEEAVQAPSITIETKQKPVDDLETKLLFNHLKGMAASLGVLEEKGAVDEGSKKEEASKEQDSKTSAPETKKSLAFNEPVNENESVALKPQLLHWHFLRSNKIKEIEVMRSKREKRKIEAKLREHVKEKERLETEIKYLEKEKKDVEHALRFAGDPEKSKLVEDEVKIEFELQQRYALKKQQENSVRNLEDKSHQMKSQFEQTLKEKSHREAEPPHILNTLGIQLDYQDNDFLLFTVTGEQLKSVRERFLSASQEGSLLKDFTPVASNFPNSEYRVSVYIEKKESLARHWHVSLVLPGQKAQLLDAIQEKDGIINYEFEEEVVFSIPNLKSELLKTQMAAMRIGLVEFGYLKQVDEKLISKPTVVSVYFSE